MTSTSLSSGVLTLLTLAGSAHAGPWLLPRGEVLLEGRFHHSVADEEFLNSGGARPFALAGELTTSTYAFTARMGLSDTLQLEFTLPVRQVSYAADPVILAQPSADADPSVFYRENVIDFSRGASGIADVEFAIAQQLTRGRFAAAVEFRLKTPTGYDTPAGTFGDNPRSEADFMARAPTLVRAENVRDDVTLGDGQVDLGATIQLGLALRSGTFFRLDAGYRLRFGAPGDQIVGGFRGGQQLWDGLLLFTGLDVEYTVTQGDIIGVSVVAEDPTLPAAQFDGTSNLRLRVLRLERDRYVFPVGAIFRLPGNVELSASYERVLGGRNTSASQAVGLGIGVRTQLL